MMRLASSVATGSSTHNLTYSYDRYGNMTCVTNQQTNGPCPNWVYNTSTNQLNVTGYTYDASGNQTADGTGQHTYQWDAENRLKSIDSGSTATYTYNALGQRVEKLVGSTYTEYAYNASGEEVGENNRSIWTVRVISFGGRHLVHYQGSPNAAYFLHVSKLGSTSQATDYSGAVAQDEIHYPWGEEWAMAGTAEEERFARLGHRDTTETGLDPTPFRMYASTEGRWFSTDPVGGRAGDPQSLNRYAYVLNHPINDVDPSGRFDLFGCDSDIEDCGCDPSVDPFCGLGGGGGGGCGVLMAVGDSGYCGPVLPLPPPPQPALPQCFCQLKYRHLNVQSHFLRFFTHSFWYIQDSMGGQWIISGFPSGPNGSGFLNTFANPDVSTGDDNVSAATWFDTGLSPAICDNADLMLLLDVEWPNDTTPYGAVLGPNSNSFAGYLSFESGFDVSAPPGAWGWYFPL